MKPIADIKKEFDEQFKDVRTEMNHLDPHIGQKPGYLWGAFRHDVLAFIQSTLTQEREELRKWVKNNEVYFDEENEFGGICGFYVERDDLLSLLQEKPDTQGDAK